MDFDGVIGEIETIWLAFKKLIAQIIIELKRRGLGAAQASSSNSSAPTASQLPRRFPFPAPVAIR